MGVCLSTKGHPAIQYFRPDLVQTCWRQRSEATALRDLQRRKSVKQLPPATLLRG